MEHAPACIALLRGPEFIFEAVNPAYAAIAPGIPMLGRSVVDVFPKIDLVVVPLLRQVLESGESFHVEDQPLNISRDAALPSETRYFSFSYTRIPDGETAATHSILVLALETTAIRKAEESRELAISDLKSQWRTFDTALSNTPDFVYTFDLEGRLTYVNSALLALWRKPLQAVVGKNFFDLDYPPDLAGRLQRQIQHVIGTKELVRDQTPFTGPTGETRHYEYIFVPVFATTGQVEAVTGSTRDVTERKLAEEQERERQIRIRDSARLESLGIMAGGIAHDFNNLLVGILGNASLLAETAQERDRALANQIVRAAERAAELTNQMLAYSGRGRFVIEVLDLNTLIQANFTLLRAFLSRSVSVDLDFGEPCFVAVDRRQIYQVIMNLLINASEAIGDRPGKVAIRTALVERRDSQFSKHLHAFVPAGFYALLEFQDSGVGIAIETIEKIFDPFFTTKFTGRGLGLAAVLGIVKGHKGDIEVESHPGVGTTFRILLPVAKGSGSPTREPDTVAAVARGSQ